MKVNFALNDPKNVDKVYKSNEKRGFLKLAADVSKYKENVDNMSALIAKGNVMHAKIECPEIILMKYTEFSPNRNSERDCYRLYGSEFVKCEMFDEFTERMEVKLKATNPTTEFADICSMWAYNDTEIRFHKDKGLANKIRERVNQKFDNIINIASSIVKYDNGQNVSTYSMTYTKKTYEEDDYAKYDN